MMAAFAVSVEGSPGAVRASEQGGCCGRRDRSCGDRRGRRRRRAAAVIVCAEAAPGDAEHRPRVLFYGAGAVGLGLASCLLQSGVEVTIVSRTDTVKSLQSNGLRRTGIFGECLHPPGSFGTVDNIQELELGTGTAYEFVFVCVKCFDAGTAALDLSRRPDLLSSSGRLVLCQNGWGSAAKFAELFSEERILNARVITGFRRPQPNVVDITVHAQPLTIGSIFDTQSPAEGTEQLCRLIDRGGLPCETSPHVAKDLWAKMFYNCALNPLGAIFGVEYGKLGESEATRSLIADVVQETFQVMLAEGYTTHVDSPPEYMDLLFSTLLPVTYSHRSSMLQALEAGKSTEIDAMNGEVVRLGRLHNVPTPVNETICKMLQFVEQQTQQQQPFPRQGRATPAVQSVRE